MAKVETRDEGTVRILTLRYPQASLRADRAALLATWGLPLAEGLRLEAEQGLATALDPEMATGLERFARHDRPDAPRPA